MRWRLIIYKIKRVYHLFKTGVFGGLIAEIQSGWPQKKMVVAAITGTDGKTTTASLLHHLLTQSGIKTGLITTLAAKIGNKEIETGLHVTNPQPKILFKLIKEMLEAGCTHVVLEMTSHGAYQFRNWGIKPQIGGITNIAHDHFDYHQNYSEYLKAKASLFKKTPLVWTNAKDKSFLKLQQILGNKIKAFSQKTYLPAEINQAIHKRFEEKYNHLNAKLATLMALELGAQKNKIPQAINSFLPIVGRMQSIANQKKLNIIVDFAHTPQAVESTLNALRARRQKKESKIIAVLGSAGQRDVSKRPLMGKIASKLADLVIFTAEDPRTENVWSIIGQLKSNLGKNHHKVLSIADRGQAIYFAINQLATAGDSVIIMGKGHEKSLCFGQTEYQWSDQETVKLALENKAAQLTTVINQ